MVLHNLKCERRFYQDVKEGKKRFELRKNDRAFLVGDLVTLHEVVDGVPTGETLPTFAISYILYGPVYALPAGWCIFSW